MGLVDLTLIFLVAYVFGYSEEGMSKRNRRFIEHCDCPYCNGSIEVVIDSDMRYGVHVSIRKVASKTVSAS